jgi:hypothetical protein
MPPVAIVSLIIVLIGCAVFVGWQIHTEVKTRKNLKRWERGEKIEGDWD